MNQQVRISSGSRELLSTTRRSLLAAGTAAALGLSGAARAQSKTNRVIVRTPGGIRTPALRKAVWEPFEKETGIQVVPVSQDVAKTVAMLQSKNVTVDVMDSGAFLADILQGMNGIEKLDRTKFVRSNLDDMALVRDHYLSSDLYATVLGYRPDAFGSRAPTSWKDFWDVQSFPGARSLEDMSAEIPNLEQALLADGVPMDKLYPLDVDRAFEMLGKIRPHILKWWNTGGVSESLIVTKQVAALSIWHGRAGALKDAGAPIEIEWNQAQRFFQVHSVVAGAPNRDNAYKYIDFLLSPQVQAEFVQLLPNGPGNRKALELVPAAFQDRLPNSTKHAPRGFDMSLEWWLPNYKAVAERWQKFLLSR